MMAKKVAVVVPQRAIRKRAPWGEANPRRGNAAVELAVSFSRAFPIGTRLTTVQFDEWAEQQELLKRPERGKDSDEWSRYLEKRQLLRTKINRSAIHPRMREQDCEPYVIDWIGDGYQVNTPERSEMIQSMLRHLIKHVSTKKRQLQHLLQAKDYEQMTDVEKAYLVVIFEQLVDIAESFSQQVLAAEKRILRFATRVGIQGPQIGRHVEDED